MLICRAMFVRARVRISLCLREGVVVWLWAVIALGLGGLLTLMRCGVIARMIGRVGRIFLSVGRGLRRSGLWWMRPSAS